MSSATSPTLLLCDQDDNLVEFFAGVDAQSSTEPSPALPPTSEDPATSSIWVRSGSDFKDLR